MKKRLNVLILKAYSGIPEAFRTLGHIIKILSSGAKRERIEKDILSFRPDFIFAMDYRIDTELFTAYKIPHLVWFVDYPLYWIGKVSISPYYLAIVQERLWVERMKRVGFKNVFYLPLGTDPGIFNGIKLEKEDIKKYGCNLSFAGDSVHTYYLKYREWIKDPEDQKLVDEVVRIQAENPSLDIQDVIETVSSSLGSPIIFKDSLSQDILMMCMEGVASYIIRKETLLEVADLGLSVYGDESWRRILHFTKAKIFPPIPYSRDGVAKLYVASKINLNISKVQFKTSVNQRPFDVACAGGFILTDYKRDIGELFELGKEMICYRDKKELRELAIYFLKHPEERKEIARRAKKRALEEHTYFHRIKELVRIVRETFGI